MSKKEKDRGTGADQKDVILPVRLEGPMHARLRQMSFDRRESMRDIVVRALGSYLTAEQY